MATFDVFNIEKEKVGTIDLADGVFAAKVNEHLFYEVVKSQLASRRAGSHAVKNRSLVSGGGKKPWKQKHTGKARQGSIRASHWVGGGKAMGPKPRDYSYRVPKKVRQGALRSALSLRAREKELIILDRWEPEQIKTKVALNTLEKLGLEKVVVIDEPNEKLSRSIRNLPGVTFLPPGGLNPYDLLRHRSVVLTQRAARQVEQLLKPSEA